MLLGGLEGGGTKMVCAIGDENGVIREKVSIPTRGPEETMKDVIDYFSRYAIDALGVACFGPLDLNKRSKTYGYITSTPKLAWRNYDILGTLKKALDVPCGFDTDVNGSALGEATYGCMKGVDTGLYITIGTGIGVGVYANGKLLHGNLHPEAGHILINRHPDDDSSGVCPYHHSCFEGLASGPAIAKRAGMPATELKQDSYQWNIEAYYIAEACMNYILTLAPQKIVLGGGVMQQRHLFPKVREQVLRLINAYVSTKELQDIENYIVPESLGGDQGIMGCMKLAFDQWWDEVPMDRL